MFVVQQLEVRVQGLPARAAAEVILDAGQRLPLEVWRLGKLPFREAGERKLLVPRYLCSRFRNPGPYETV